MRRRKTKRQIMKSKKGVSEIIAWILLLGFSVSLAVIIYNWSRTQTEDLTQSTVSFVEGKLECQEVSTNVATNPECNQLTITNRGKLNIDQFAIRTFTGDQANSLIEEGVLTPKKSKIVNIQNPDKIEVIPIVEINNKMIGCNEKKIFYEC